MPLHRSNQPEIAPVSRRILVFGCGYLGRRVAGLAVEQGHEVWATTRDVAKGQALRRQRIEPLLADWTDRRTLSRLPEVDWLLVSVSHDPKSPHGRFEGQVGGLRNLLEVVPNATSVCYISTTGVFHQSDGRWVDECSPTHPTRAGARAHLQGEAMLHRRRPHSPWTILRLAGIYGPQRIPRLADVRAGRPIVSNAESYLNLIHVDDASRAVLAAWTSARERLYLVADDQPVLRGDYYRFIAQRCGAPEPIFAPPGEEASDRSRSEGNKRIWNRRMKRDLLPLLRYPTFREGLRELL